MNDAIYTNKDNIKLENIKVKTDFHNFYCLDKLPEGIVENSLKASLEIIRYSDFPVFVIWGNDYRCFFNELFLQNSIYSQEINGDKLEDISREIYQDFIAQELPEKIRDLAHFTTKTNGFAAFMKENVNPGWVLKCIPLSDDKSDPQGLLISFKYQKDYFEAINVMDNNLKQIIGQAPVAVAIFSGPEYVVEKVNTKALELWGRSEEQVLNKPILESMPELVNQGFRDIFDGVYLIGKRFEANSSPVEILREGALQTVYINFSYEPVRDYNNNIVGFVAFGIDVTHEVNTRRQIELNEQRMRAFIENAPFPIGIYTGKEMRIEIVNQSIIDVWGKGNDIIGKRYQEVLPELENQEVFDQLQQVYNSGVTFEAKNQKIELEVNGRNKIYYFNYIFTPLFDPEGKVYGVMNTAADVTDLNLALFEIERTEERLRLATDVAEIATWEIARDADVFIADAKLNEIFGLKSEEVLTRDIVNNQIFEEDLQMVRQHHEQAYKSGTYAYDARIVRPDGSLRWVHTRGKVMFDENGEFVKLIGTTRDITDEKIQQHKLVESESKFRLMANSIPQFVWTSDAKGDFNYFSQTVYEYSGLSESELIRDGWLKVIHPDEREANKLHWLKCVETGEDFNFEHRFRRHDGVYRWQLSRATPQYDASGKIYQWVGSSTDIEEQKMFSAELEKQVSLRTKELELKNEDLNQMNDELQSFAYISSHDLQEPLRKIQTFASRLIEKEYATMSSTAKDYFTRMQKSAHRMQVLINDLISYSRTNTDERIFEESNLGEIIAEVGEEINETLSDNKISIEVDIECCVEVVTFQIRQLFQNLISNSMKFAREGIPAHVTILGRKSTDIDLQNGRIDPEREYLHIAYTDNGIGFDKQYSEKIFELFQRLHGRDSYQGTGIGLAIVKKIIDNHGGFIRATSRENEGARFDIYLPVKQ